MINLKKLNCMNYYVHDEISNDYWYAQNGLRSLFEYAKISNKTFREICQSLNDKGEITIRDIREIDDFITERGNLTLTMI